MEQNIHQQILDLIAKSKKFLIILPKILDEDNLPSALALAGFLKKLDKEVQIFSSGEVPKTLKFLPLVTEVKKTLGVNLSFVISVDVVQKQVAEISYQNLNGKLEIFLKPKTEMFTPADVTFSAEKFPADCLIFLGVKSLPDTGEVFSATPDLFFETPKINIDHQSANEYFGNLNLVDLTATSVAEILTSLFEKFETQLVDADIATSLLSGIIAKTHSFQHVTTTPRAFLHASNLIGLGGRQQEIIKNIYKTKSLALLKIWGRALARLKTVEEKSLAYSLLNSSDFQKSSTENIGLEFVISEILDNISGYNIVALLTQKKEQETEMLVAVNHSVDSSMFAKKIGGKVLDKKVRGYNLVAVPASAVSLEETENKLLSVL